MFDALVVGTSREALKVHRAELVLSLTSTNCWQADIFKVACEADGSLVSGESTSNNAEQALDAAVSGDYDMKLAAPTRVMQPVEYGKYKTTFRINLKKWFNRLQKVNNSSMDDEPDYHLMGVFGGDATYGSLYLAGYLFIHYDIVTKPTSYLLS